MKKPEEINKELAFLQKLSDLMKERLNDCKKQVAEIQGKKDESIQNKRPSSN